MERAEDTPAVSIILATFNRASLLPRALTSVIRQTMPHWELIVVDDGSQDATPVLLQRELAREPRLRVVRQENRGLVAARNRGAELAKAPWLTFIDSDDEYAPDHLEKRLAFVREHPSVDMLHGGVTLVGNDVYVPDVNNPSRRIHLSECVIGGTFFLRTSCFRALGGFSRPDFGCDYAFFQRAQRQLVIEKVEFPTYVYHRDSLDSMCQQFIKPPLRNRRGGG